MVGSRGLTVFPLPTGKGLCVKPPAWSAGVADQSNTEASASGPTPSFTRRSSK